MKSFKKKIYAHRSKEDNRDIIKRAEQLKFTNISDLYYLGSEICFEVEIFEDGFVKILKIDGVDVSDLKLQM